MAWRVLRAKGEKWSGAIKMKPEKVFALGQVFSFFPWSKSVSPSLILIPFCPFPVQGLYQVFSPTLSIAGCHDPMCSRQANFTKAGRPGDVWDSVILGKRKSSVNNLSIALNIHCHVKVSITRKPIHVLSCVWSGSQLINKHKVEHMVS